MARGNAPTMAVVDAEIRNKAHPGFCLAYVHVIAPPKQALHQLSLACARWKTSDLLCPSKQFRS